MFETLDFGKSLDENLFDSWLEKGRNSRLGYQYLFIIWDTLEEEFKPLYSETREQLDDLINPVASSEILVAAYDLYSESKISLD